MHRAAPNLGWLPPIALFVVMSACGGARGPDATVRSFGRSLEAGQVGDAYDDLSRTYQQRVPLREFREQVAAHPQEMRTLAGLLRRAGDVTARVTLADGSTIDLVFEEGRWRIEGNPANYYDQSTPRRALRSFVRAIRNRRYDVVLRFVPEADQDGMSEERIREAWEGSGREGVERLAAQLAASLDAPIEEIGDRATMSYGDGATVQFVREDRVWKIEDPR